MVTRAVPWRNPLERKMLCPVIPLPLDSDRPSSLVLARHLCSICVANRRVQSDVDGRPVLDERAQDEDWWFSMLRKFPDDLERHHRLAELEVDDCRCHLFVVNKQLAAISARRPREWVDKVCLAGLLWRKGRQGTRLPA